VTHKILIVDDSPTQVALLSHSLQQYAVEVAIDGVTGLECALRGNFALLILDLNLPDLSGLELGRRYSQTNPTTPILITSSEDQLAKLDYSQNSGQISYCIKDIPAILNRVELIFLRQRRLQHSTSSIAPRKESVC
jgi:DNA-binding response OmpR family regulator